MSAKSIILYDHVVVDLDPLSVKMDWGLINNLMKFKNNLKFETFKVPPPTERKSNMKYELPPS